MISASSTTKPCPAEGSKQGGRADRAVHIRGRSAAAADDVMVVIADPRLIAARMAGRLDSSDKPRLLQNVQVVIHGLGGERP